MSHNTWVHKGVRYIVRPLAATQVSPNQITLCRLITGLGAAAVLAWDGDEGRVLGAILFCLSFVLDRADGELARISGKTSAAGHRFDLWSDAVCHVMIFVGLGIGLQRGGVDWAAAQGIVAGISVGLILWMVLRIEASAGVRSAELRSFAGFDVDDTVLLIPLALFLDQAEILLWASALSTPTVALVFFWAFRRQLRSGTA